MENPPVSLGSAVRYEETVSRWFIGVVRRIAVPDVEIEFLGGARKTVRGDKVDDLLSYLRARKRVLSLTRENLCYAFYGERPTRLRRERADQMRHFLRKHGLRYQPEEWSADARIQIWPDDSCVAPGDSAADRAFDALLPKWLEPHRLPAGSRDPLGFQNSAERIANEFLPGLTVFTSRIAYYGLIAWAVRELNQHQWGPGTVLREHFHKLERAYVLCEFVYHGSESNDCRVIGQRSKGEVLQSALNDRFRTPARILRNQESTGSLRLYTTSMESMGFVELRPELAADGLLPLSLTDLGKRLAHEFEKHVPEGFLDFALRDKSRDRDTLREWGRKLCMSTLGGIRYRVPFLEGFLLGNSQPAEARYRTVSLLMKRKLIGEDYRAKPGAGRDTLPEEAANVAEDEAENDGLSSGSVLLNFYEEAPRPEIERLQRAAVYELLSLALSAIFSNAIDALDKSGQCEVSALRDAIVANKSLGRYWLAPFGGSGRVPTARELHDALFDAATPVEMAAVGGVMLRRVRQDPAFNSTAPDLVDTPTLMLQHGLAPEKPLANSFAGLMESMVARHEQVSINKNRQRWCYLEGSGRRLVKDDIRPLGVGWHSMQFPQLFSLCRDLRLTKDDLGHGR